MSQCTLTQQQFMRASQLFAGQWPVLMQHGGSRGAPGGPASCNSEGSRGGCLQRAAECSAWELVRAPTVFEPQVCACVRVIVCACLLALVCVCVCARARARIVRAYLRSCVFACLRAHVYACWRVGPAEVLIRSHTYACSGRQCRVRGPACSCLWYTHIPITRTHAGRGCAADGGLACSQQVPGLTTTQH